MLKLSQCELSEQDGKQAQPTDLKIHVH